MIAQLTWSYVRARPSKVASRLISYAAFEGRPLTTRGQWINPLVFALGAVSKRLPPIRRVYKPVFIVGTGRSGTTILGMVMSMHRDVGFLNEPKALWHSLHPNEDVIGSYSRAYARYRLDAGDATPDMRRAAQRAYSTYLLMSGARRVVDKYPELVFRIPFVKALFPDARFLMLVRNGWDASKSVESWSARYGRREKGERHDWWGANDRKWRYLIEQVACEDPCLCRAGPELRRVTDQRVRAAVEWTLTMRVGLQAARYDPGAVKVVQYEQLTLRPEETVADILIFSDLRADPVVLKYAARTLLPSRRPREQYPLPEWLAPAFEDAMLALGYAR